MPTNGRDWARALAVDDSGNVYVTGHSEVTGVNHDYVTVKYDSDGNEEWVARYNGPAENRQDEAYALAVDSSGNVYVTGESSGSGTGYSDYATIKYRPVISPVDFLAFYDENIGDENLRGQGPGESSQYQENVIRTMIANMINLFGDGHIEAAFQQLQVIYLKIDGEPNPSDFIGGDEVVIEEFRQHACIYKIGLVIE